MNKQSKKETKKEFLRKKLEITLAIERKKEKGMLIKITTQKERFKEIRK